VEPRVKGVSFKSVLRALETLHGPSSVEACMSTMPSEVADGFRYGTILASGWYPIGWYRALLAAAQTAAGQGDRALFEIGRQCARQDMTGVYRLGFKLLSPQTVIRLASRLFSNYYDTGECLVVSARVGFVHARWLGCRGFDRRLWSDAFGAAHMFMELAGASNIRSQLAAGGGDGDETAELIAHWT
jgi:hypothetical protein